MLDCSFACRLHGLLRTNSRPSIHNRLSPRFCNRGFVSVPRLRAPLQSVVIGNSNGCVPGCIAQTEFQTAQTQQAVGTVCSCLRCVGYKRVNELVRTYWAERVLFSVCISKSRTIVCWFYIAHRIIDLADSLNERFNLLLVKSMQFLHRSPRTQNKAF